MEDLKSPLRPFKWFGRAVYYQKDVEALLSVTKSESDDMRAQLDTAARERKALKAQMETDAQERKELAAQLDASRVSEAEAWEALTREQEASAAQKAAHMQEMQQVEHFKEVAKHCEELEKEMQQIDQERQNQESSLSELSARFQQENMSLSKQVEDVKFELEESQKRSQHLTECLEAERNAVREYQSVASRNVVGEANERAKQIVSDAVVQSDRILSEVVEQRNRVISASRSMCYNAMQFKMSLAMQFSAMEKDLDESIDLLRILEAVPLGGTTGSMDKPSRYPDAATATETVDATATSGATATETESETVKPEKEE